MSAGYSYDDMMKLQSEAAQRVRNMQNRARQTVEKAARTQETESRRNSQTVTGEESKAKSTSLPLDYLNKSDDQKSETVKNPRGNTSDLSGVGSNINASDGLAFNDEKLPSSVSGADYEKLLLLFIILLISSEQADDIMISALIYLLV